MPETFLILLAGGIMLAAGVCDPKQVTLNFLRLAGILALSAAGLSLFFLFKGPEAADRREVLMTLAVIVAILAQLATAQIGWRASQRIFAFIALILALNVAEFQQPIWKDGTWLLEISWVIGTLLIAAMSGLALMDMLLGHAYLTASQMTMAPFMRLNRSLAVAMASSILLTLIALAIHFTRDEYLFWGRYGLLLITRWLVGLAVPAVFIYMAHDCIKRRATQSATGILYVAGVLIFIGEIVSLYLLRETRLPF
jgi:hypothetical protein